MYVVIIIIAIVALGATQLQLPQLQENQAEKNQLEQAEGFVQNYWYSYLEKPVLYIWNNLFTNLLWTATLDNLERINNGQPTDFQNWAPKFGTSKSAEDNSGEPAITIKTERHTEIDPSQDIGS